MNKEELNREILKSEYYYENLKDKVHDLHQEVDRLNKILERIDIYIHLWKIDEIDEKTMLILNDILLIKNGMKDEVVRLKKEGK